ncbi:MAG: 16S rRNA (guanine(527)-N(7))-methyltransferase RsmG [Bacteroidetes bacterium]|nr:16S rRNA (guanine(527)-N(7))-methyltransferase RsmG [Bacteroidota bacterium]MBL7103801.1 16S rRNA (guanine(527)-N(7))-methyltransferase RsmG [Bacteroidales bacterium]
MEIVRKYFPQLTNRQKYLFSRLQPLYNEWNSKINVISRKDISHLYERHVLHSLAIAKIVKFKSNTHILDVGTGGGFPGIPLAIMFPDTQFHLVDSTGKKIKVVQEVVVNLGLENVTYEQARAEQLTGKYDFIVSRAVVALPVFYKWVSNLISRTNRNEIPNGILYLKGGDYIEELKQMNTLYRVYSLSDYFGEEFFKTKKLIHLF